MSVIIEPTFHGPMVAGSVCDQTNDVDRNPLPEDDLFSHGVGLHLVLHLNVEDLQCFPRWTQHNEYILVTPMYTQQMACFKMEYVALLKFLSM